MQGAFAASGALDRGTLQILSRRSDAWGASQILVHVVALAASGWLVAAARGTPWVVAALWLYGVLLAFLFAPLHECIHRTAFRSRFLNDAVAVVCGLALLLPPRYFRTYHIAHHRDTQDPERDPELAVPRPASLASYLAHLSGLPYWRERFLTLVRHARNNIREPFVSEQQASRIAREARIALGLYGLIAVASVALQNQAVLFYWVFPSLIGQPALRLFLLAEHAGCPPVRDMFANSRTTRSTVLLRRLAWNMNYHAEHHAFPSLPFHALPQAHELLRDRIAVEAPGYLAVHRELVARVLARRGVGRRAAAQR